MSTSARGTCPGESLMGDGAAVVVGALSSVGRAVCFRLVRSQPDSTLVLVDTAGDDLSTLQRELTQAGGKVALRSIAPEGNGEWAQVLAAELGAAYPRVDRVLYADEPCSDGSLLTISLQEWCRAFGNGARKPWQLAKAMTPLLCAAKGSLVMLGVAIGSRLQLQQAASRVAKMSLTFLIQALALELGKEGARANVVEPGDLDATAALVELLFDAGSSALNGQRLTARIRAPTTGARQGIESQNQAQARSAEPEAARLVVTGGGGAIASAICRSTHAASLARGGPSACVLLVDLDADPLSTSAVELRALGMTVDTLIGDVSDTDLPGVAITRAVSLFGGVDAVFSNAGCGFSALVSQMETRDFDRTFDVNLRAAWLLARAAFEPLARSTGNFIATGSIGALQPGLSAPVYGASKSGVICLIEQLALAFAPAGVRANSVSPGSTMTAMNRLWGLPADERARQVARYPLKRMALPGEIGDAMAFLTGPHAKYITGHNLVVDGGLSLAAAPY